MSFCPKCGTSLSEGAGFCSSCGTKTAVSAENAAPVNRAGKLHCPNCKSYNFSTVTESSVNGAVSTGHNIRATSVSNTHRNYWMCSDCGTKFRNIQNLEEEIQKSKNNPLIATIITIISAAVAVFLFVKVMSNALAGLMLGTYAITAVVVTIVCFIYIFVYKNRLKKMRSELTYLKQNCFD